MPCCTLADLEARDAKDENHITFFPPDIPGNVIIRQNLCRAVHLAILARCVFDTASALPWINSQSLFSLGTARKSKCRSIRRVLSVNSSIEAAWSLRRLCRPKNLIDQLL
eukprot:2976103-Amphidinium_carterae.1